MKDSEPIPFDDTQPSMSKEMLDAINARFDRGSARMGRMEQALAENTAITKRIDANTAGLVEWSQNLEGASKVVGAIMAVAKPLAILATMLAALTGFWVAFKTGVGWK